MGELLITGGSHPTQKATAGYGKITLRDNKRQILVYSTHAAITSLDEVSQSWGKKTFKISLRDGNTLLCNAKGKLYDELYQDMVTGPRGEEVVVRPENSLEKTTRLTLRYGSPALALCVIAAFIASPKPNDPTLTPSMGGDQIEECCRLMGETAACGINNEAISRTCGRMIDDATSYGSSARGKRLKNCMNTASYAATSSPDCKSVLQRMQQYR